LQACSGSVEICPPFLTIARRRPWQFGSAILCTSSLAAITITKLPLREMPAKNSTQDVPCSDGAKFRDYLRLGRWSSTAGANRIRDAFGVTGRGTLGPATARSQSHRPTDGPDRRACRRGRFGRRDRWWSTHPPVTSSMSYRSRCISAGQQLSEFSAPSEQRQIFSEFTTYAALEALPVAVRFTGYSVLPVLP
jgi:hypothetical protein